MKPKRILLAVMPIALLLVLVATACGPEMPAAGPTEQPTAAQQPTGDWAVQPAEPAGGAAVTTASGLQYTEIQPGDGPAPEPGAVYEGNKLGLLFL